MTSPRSSSCRTTRSGWSSTRKHAAGSRSPRRRRLGGGRRDPQRDNALLGLLAHPLRRSDDGIRVVDVWDTREVLDRFAEEQIGPYTREVGFKEEPQMRFYDVHNH